MNMTTKPECAGVNRLMNYIIYIPVVIMALVMACGQVTGDTQTEAEASRHDEGFSIGDVHFTLNVWPVIESRCLPCHGSDPNKIKGGLTMRNKEEFFQGGDNFADLTSIPDGELKPLIIQVISRSLEDFEMPPKEADRLTDKQIADFETWIAGGLSWPDSDTIQSITENLATGVTVKTSGGLSRDWDERRYPRESLWAFQPWQDDFTTHKYHKIGINPIDSILAHQYEREQLTPSGPAQPAQLVKRLSYTLTGLPPGAGLMKQVEGTSTIPDADWEKLVDSYLNRPAYGEKMAGYWLDLVRYADSAGLANDFMRGHAWRYRDYIIRAFNEDKPYAQFIREQLAGDEIPNPTADSLIATGFLRMGPWELTGMEVAKIARQRFLDDVTDLTGQVFLSQPLQCARCHDHKFDPIPTRDYYAIQAAFAHTQLAEIPVSFQESEIIRESADREIMENRREYYISGRERLDNKLAAAQREWCIERGLPPRTRSEAQKLKLPDEEIPPRHAGFSVQDFGMERIVRKGLIRMSWESAQYSPAAHAVYNGAWPDYKNYQNPMPPPDDPWKGIIDEVTILQGGDPFAPGDPVRPGHLSVMDRCLPAPDMPEGRTGLRLALANWIASEKNVLAVRSIVNRVWLWNFGRGLVETPNHFGVNTQPPVNAELLDFLCHYFLENGGSIRELNKLILTSETWRRSSIPSDREKLGELQKNHACFTPRRLTAEEIRDSHLAISGELNRSMGGPAVKPLIDMETALQPRMVMGTFAEAWQPSVEAHTRNRRSIYTLKLRGLRAPFADVFDTPSPDLSCARRTESSVPTQALALLNNPAVFNRATASAGRMKFPSLNEAIIEAYQSILFRNPDPEEMEKAGNFVRSMISFHKKHTIPAPHYPSVVTRQAVEENTGEPFEFTEILEGFSRMEPEPFIGDLPPERRALAELIHVLMTSNEFFHIL